MRCKKHFSDVSSSVGVCASCLRERLLSLIDAQSKAHQAQLAPPEDRRNSDPRHHQPQQLPPPLVFPRSVSPYISRRKSDASVATDDDIAFSNHRCQQQRFFSTPQVGPTCSKKKSKFRVIANLFRSRSAKSTHPSDPFSDPHPPSKLHAPSSKSSSWVSGFVSHGSGHRKNTTLRLFSLDEKSAYDGRPGKWLGNRHRGLSPDIREDYSDPGSPSPSGYSPEPWKGTPSSTRGSTRGRIKASPARSHVASGFGICLSPLMRPSPSRNWNGKGAGPGGASETGYSAEFGSTVKPYLSTAASLRANRSRKLADFGRFNHNR